MQNISHRICLFVVVVVIVVVGGWWGAMVLVVPPKAQWTASVTGGSVTLWIVTQCFTPGRGPPSFVPVYSGGRTDIPPPLLSQVASHGFSLVHILTQLRHSYLPM